MKYLLSDTLDLEGNESLLDTGIGVLDLKKK